MQFDEDEEDEFKNLKGGVIDLRSLKKTEAQDKNYIEKK
jgi:hypothetical protein